MRSGPMSYETTLNYLQEMRKTQKDQQELIEEQKQRLEEQTEEPPSKRLRTEEPWAKSRKDLARSEYAESQVESQSGFPAIDVTSIAEALPRIARWRSLTWR